MAVYSHLHVILFLHSQQTDSQSVRSSQCFFSNGLIFTPAYYYYYYYYYWLPSAGGNLRDVGRGGGRKPIVLSQQSLLSQLLYCSDPQSFEPHYHCNPCTILLIDLEKKSMLALPDILFYKHIIALIHQWLARMKIDKEGEDTGGNDLWLSSKGSLFLSREGKPRGFVHVRGGSAIPRPCVRGAVQAPHTPPVTKISLILNWDECPRYQRLSW